MIKVVMANYGYKTHMTDEGEQLQEGLKHAGWILSGAGYDGITDVKDMLNKYKPDMVFIQDPRDWDAKKFSCFDKRYRWDNWGVLKNYNGFKIGVVKDAGSLQDYQQLKAEEMGYNAIVHYYNYLSVSKYSQWVKAYKCIRHYHTVDRDLISRLAEKPPERKNKAVISGAIYEPVYPVRARIVEAIKNNEYDIADYVDFIKHPGYNANGSVQEEYYKTLAEYKISIATASKYDFELRKIVEGVCMGCNVMTNCITYAGIDNNIITYFDNEEVIYMDKFVEKIKQLLNKKNYGINTMYSLDCDYRFAGEVLNDKIMEAYNERR